MAGRHLREASVALVVVSLNGRKLADENVNVFHTSGRTSDERTPLMIEKLDTKDARRGTYSTVN